MKHKPSLLIVYINKNLKSIIRVDFLSNRLERKFFREKLLFIIKLVEVYTIRLFHFLRNSVWSKKKFK